MKHIFAIFCLSILGYIPFYASTTCGNGTFSSHLMPCKLLQGVTQRDYSIYLPASYGHDTLRVYPVLYLMHGGGGTHSDWQTQVHITQMLDSLTACSAINDMVVVCPEGNKQNMMYFNAPQWRYEDYFFNELIPYIEKNYRVRTDKGGRAIAGFSMGGGAAVVYGVHHPEMFSMVGDISGYLCRQPLDFLKNDNSAESRQQVIEANNRIVQITKENDCKWQTVDWYITVGDHDFTLEANMDFVKVLRLKNIQYTFKVTEGMHDWKFVSSSMSELLKRADRNFHSIWIAIGSRRIFGELSRSTSTGEKKPLVIISHGFNGNSSFSKSYFLPLEQMGYQCYAFDFPCGALNSRSDNNTLNMSVLDEVADLKSVVKFFQQQSYVASDSIIIIGESQGGLVSALTASELKDEIQKLVLVFPALCIPDNWNAKYPNENAIPDTTNVWGVPVGRHFFTEVRKLKPFEIIGNYTNPVLIIQGDKDPIVSMEDSRKAISIYNTADLYVIPGAGHGFKPDEFKLEMQEIRKFLR